MSNKVDVKLNSSGIQELMKSESVQELLLATADTVVKRCDGSYATNVYVGKTRANASIITNDSATYHRNLKNNELLKALG